MSKPIEYYLVARNKETNDFKIINLNKKKANSLEDIDLFTLPFNNEQEFTFFLKKHDIVCWDNNDFFIVSPRMINGKKSLNKMEVLYSKYDVLKPIAINSKNKELAKSNRQIDAILDGFATIMRQHGSLYQQVVSGKTNVYPKFANYFIMNNGVKQETIKYRDGGWARTSYPLIRNILEAEGREKDSYKTIQRDLYRSLLDEQLLEQTSVYYVEDQVSMFDMLEDKKDEEKLLEIINTFENIKKNTFIIDKENKASFNPNIFITYQEDDLNKLKDYLPERLQYTLQLLAMQREDFFLCGVENTTSIRQGLKLILSLLKSNKELFDKSYEWCIIYNKYKEMIKGEKNGREYQKGRGEF